MTMFSPNIISSFQLLFVCTFCVCICAAIKPTIISQQSIWVSGKEAEIKMYRTPILIKTPPGDLLAFAAGRSTSGGDVSSKIITMRRSTNGGDSFDVTQIIVDDGHTTPDGLNLGNIIVDRENNTILILYCFCARDKCKPKRPASMFMTRSHNWGYTWSPPVDLGVKSTFLEGWHWCPGPGYGIQKASEPNKGRLIACGHTIGFFDMVMACIYSDDHGDTWHKGAEFVGLPYQQTKQTGDLSLGEPQMVELPNGTLLVNVRNEKHYHCKCRVWLKSTDGGETFPIRDMRTDPTLVDPPCQGSTLIHTDGTMYFSNPASGSQRINMTLRWSHDFGRTWDGFLTVHSKEAEYSCLTEIDQNHIGLLYERNGYSEIAFAKIKVK